MVSSDSVPATVEPRPFYLSFVLWGKGFRDHFADYCVASLLAEGNLPALVGRRRVKVLIATTPEDWRALKENPLMRRLEELAETVFLEIPPAPPGRSGSQHMGVGHVQTTEYAYRDGAYLCGFVPDMVVSDHTMTFLDRKAREGFQVVLCTSIRAMEEGFLSAVRKIGLAPGVAPGDANGVVRLSGRQLVDITMANLHSQGVSWGWDSPSFSTFPVAPYWRVPGEKTWIFHSLHWVPLLLDYGAIKSHDVSTFKDWTMDGDYVHRNFASCDKVHIVRDSDEAMLEGWSPAADRPVSLAPPLLQKTTFTSRFSKGMTLHNTFQNPVFDETKREYFFTSIVWHAADVDHAKLKATESSVRKIIEFWCPRGDIFRLHTLRFRVLIFLLFRLARMHGWGRHFATVQIERSQFALYCLQTGQYDLLRRKTIRRLLIMASPDSFVRRDDTIYRRWWLRLIMFGRLARKGYFYLIWRRARRRVFLWYDHFWRQRRRAPRPEGRILSSSSAQRALQAPAYPAEVAKAWEDIAESSAKWQVCWTMAVLELRRRYRRTVIGPFWATLSHALFIGIMGVLFAALWKIEIATYLPFLASGLICWMLISTIVTDGAAALITAEPLVKQTHFPYAFFANLVVVRNILVFGHHLVVYVVVAALFSVPVNQYTLLALPGLALVALTGVWLAMLAGMLCARYRDVQQLITALLQLMMFVTPVFWPPDQLGSRFALFVNANILYHYVNVIRAPLLGTPPPLLSWLVAIGFTLLGGLVTFFLFARFRRKIIFWI